MQSTYIIDKQINNFLHTVCNRIFTSFYNEVRLFRSLIFHTNAGEATYLSGACLLIKAFDIPFFTYFDRSVDKAFKKGKSVAFVYFSGTFTIFGERTDKTGQSYCTAICEKSGHFCDSTNIFSPILSTERQITVKPVTNIIAIESVSMDLMST